MSTLTLLEVIAAAAYKRSGDPWWRKQLAWLKRMKDWEAQK